jgi:hypothetical protein
MGYGLRVLRIFGPKKDEATGGWRKLHNEELHSLYSSLSIIRMIKSRRIARVEAGSNTSTVTLRVVRGDEMGLKRPRHSLSG